MLLVWSSVTIVQRPLPIFPIVHKANWSVCLYVYVLHSAHILCVVLPVHWCEVVLIEYSLTEDIHSMALTPANAA